MVCTRMRRPPHSARAAASGSCNAFFSRTLMAIRAFSVPLSSIMAMGESRSSKEERADIAPLTFLRSRRRSGRRRGTTGHVGLNWT
eukprot:scaffold9423_cov132-Isochrysis_galbana.AAC.2